MAYVARNMFYLYAQSIVAAGAGYAFWLIISRLTDPETIGLASTTVAVAGVAISLATLGVPDGIQRFLGKAVYEDDRRGFRLYLKISLLTVGLSTIGLALVLIVVNRWLSSLIGLPFEFLMIAIIITFASAFTSTLTGAYIAALRVKVLLAAQVLASSLRLVLGVLLVLLGMGALGAAISYSVLQIALLAILGIAMVGYRTVVNTHSNNVTTREVATEVLEAGSASWVPNVVYTLGMQLGVIVAFEIFGAFEAGLYFIALSISTVIMGIYSSIMGIAFPLLSGMKDGRKKAAWRTIRISMIFSIPITIALITYPRIVLGLFGAEYAAADSTLIVLLISTIPLTILTGVNTLAYAYGNYRQVIVMGLARNMPSVLLYFILTPLYGGLGAGYAYLVGALTGLATSVWIAHRIDMKIVWLDFVKAVSIPLAVGIIAYMGNLHWLAGGSLILTISLVGYAKINLVTKQDLKELTEAMLPKNLIETLHQRFSWMINFLYKKQPDNEKKLASRNAEANSEI